MSGMSSTNIVTATFPSARYATAAVDWFLNQAIDRDAITVEVAAHAERPRAPRPGDNRRSDLTWLVSIDVERAGLRKQDVIQTMKREGGTLAARPTAGV
jgi:hypothetical protein